MSTTMRYLRSRRTVRPAGAVDLIRPSLTTPPPPPRPQRAKHLGRVSPLPLSYRDSRQPVTSLASSTTRETSSAPEPPISRLQLALRELRAKTPPVPQRLSNTVVTQPAEASRGSGHLVLRSRPRANPPPKPPVSSTTLAPRRPTVESQVRQLHRAPASTLPTAPAPTGRKSSLKQPGNSSRPKKSVTFNPTVRCRPVTKWIDKELDTRTSTELALSRYLLPLEQIAAARARNQIRRVNPFPVPTFWPLVIS